MNSIVYFLRMWADKWFCKHKWREYNRSSIYGDHSKLPICIEATLVCKVCGEIKKINI